MTTPNEALQEPEDHARDQAKSQLEGVRELVAALNVDYDRLEELQGDYDSLREAIDDAIRAIEDAEANVGDSNVLDACDALRDAEFFLYNWPDREEFEDMKRDAGEFANREEVEQRISEDPLSVLVRSDWYSPGASGEDIAPVEFEILLCTGGPAVRIRGDLNLHNEPSRAGLEYQDWGTPWTEYYEPGISDTLVEYSRQFYFGD